MLQRPKTFAKTSDGTRLKFLFLRLVGQDGTQAVSIDNNLTRGWKLQCPVERHPARTTAIMNFEEVSFVTIVDEACVRIGVGERLMTASGANARKLLAWARTCGALKPKDPIPKIPADVKFDCSIFNICVQDGELAFA
jgi:hypothetical protein